MSYSNRQDNNEIGISEDLNKLLENYEQALRNLDFILRSNKDIEKEISNLENDMNDLIILEEERKASFQNNENRLNQLENAFNEIESLF